PAATRPDGCRSAGTDRPPHRPAEHHVDRIRRPRRPTRRTYLRRRTRWPGAALADHTRAGRTRAVERSEAARPRRASAQGLDEPAAAVAARDRGTAGRISF